MDMELRTLSPAELKVPSLVHPDMIMLPEADGIAHTRVLHMGVRLRSFRHEGQRDRRIIDLRGGRDAAMHEDAIVASLGADGLRGLARHFMTIAREIDGQGEGPHSGYGRKSA